jgi:hypothetical protein
VTRWEQQKHGAQGRWGSKPVSALVQFGAGGASANGAVSRKCTPSPAPTITFLDPLTVIMDLPPLDRFPFKDSDLDPADPDWAEQVEEEKGERQADLERDGQC